MLKQIGKHFGGGGKQESAADQLEEIEKFEYVHERKENEPALGGPKAGIVPTTRSGETTKLYVTEKLFAHTRLTDKLKKDLKVSCKPTFVTKTKDADGKKVKIFGKSGNVKDRVFLFNQEGDVFGVVIQHVSISGQIYRIYGVEPYVPRQHPSDYHYEDQKLYMWAEVSIKPKDVFTMDMFAPGGGFRPEGRYTVERFDCGGGLFSGISQKPWIVKKNTEPAAVLRQGDFPDGITGPAWNVTVAPGIDPCLLIGLIAVMDTQTI